MEDENGKDYEETRKIQKAYEQYELSQGYKTSIDLLKNITRCVMFEGGKQWSMDEDIEDFPKITINVIKQIGKARKTNIIQNNYGYLVNSTNGDSTRKIQDFLKHLAKVSKLRRCDLKALSDDYKKGTGIMYFYWDAEKRGFMRKSGGEMRVENVDIRNFAVADPHIQDIQNQEWVMYVTRERVDSLKEKYPDAINDIIADAMSYTSTTEKEAVEPSSEQEFTNVYVKFFRNFEGQVFFETTTQFALLKEATPLNPFYDIEKAKKRAEAREVKYGVDEPATNTTSTMDEKKEKPKDLRDDKVWNLYPFASLVLNERDNCFYGYPVIMEYIEAQKSINNHHSVYDKAVQDNVLGGFVYKDGVVEEDEITTGNGQMLGLQLSPGEKVSDVFGRMPVANVPQDSLGYSQNLIAVTRQVAGVNNVQLGQSDYAGQSGKQTQVLLDRAKENTSDTAMLFTDFKEAQAEIMFLFAKFFYDNEAFTITEHGMEEDKKTLYTEGSENGSFNGTEYLEDDVMLDISVGTAPSFSEFTNLELLGLMVQSGQIPFEVYLSMLPDGYVSNREELKKLATENSNTQIEGLTKQLEQSKQVISQMVEAYKKTEEDRKNIKTISANNASLRSMLAEQTAKSIEMLNEATKKNNDMIEEMRKLVQISMQKK